VIPRADIKNLNPRMLKLSKFSVHKIIESKMKNILVLVRWESEGSKGE
jgi:hypothetical protein